MHITNRLGTPPRHEQTDLGLSPRELFQLQDTFIGELIRLNSRTNDKPQNSLWREISDQTLIRSGVRTQSANSICIPTGAKIFRASPEIQRRDALVSGTGGYLVGTTNQSFIDLLRNRMVAFQMGATRLSGLVGNVTIPKQTVGATAYWLASETTSITEGNQTFVQAALTPNTVAAYTQISRLLQLQSSPDAQQVIINDLAQQVAVAADLAIIAGTGTEQPTGIIGTAGIGAFTGTSLDTAALLNAQTDVATANALTAASGYVTTPAVATLLMSRQRFAGPTGDALWTGNVMDGQVLGMKAMSSMQMPTGTALFGDWSSVIVAEWGVLEIAVNPADDFAKGLTGIRAMLTMDVALRNAGAFSLASSIT